MSYYKLPDCGDTHIEMGPLLEAFNGCLDIVESKNYVIKDCLGCGTYGCAFLLEGGKILKITSDAEEAGIAYLFKKSQKKHVSIPLIDEVFKFPVKCEYFRRQGSFWGIVREELQDVPWKDDRDALEGIINELDDMIKVTQDVDLIQEFIEETAEELDLPKSDVNYLQQISQFLFWSIGENLTLDDMIPENWGLRGETVVIRDASSMPNETLLLHDIPVA